MRTGGRGRRLLLWLLLAAVLLAIVPDAGMAGLGAVSAEAAMDFGSSMVMMPGQKRSVKMTASGKVTYRSTNSKVASVSGSGVITAKKQGKVTITAVCGKKKQTHRLYVISAPSVHTSDAVRGIDVSAYQGNVDFKKVKASGVRFVILRIGHGTAADSYFQRNYAKAKAAGLKVGGYWFSTALSNSAAKKEAQRCLKAIRGKSFDFPVFVDIEYLPQLRKGMYFCGNVVNTFCMAVKKAGFRPGYYTSRSFIGPYVGPKTARTRGYFSWVAEYGMKLNYRYSCNMWQYGLGRVSGIRGPVDVDFYFPSEKNGIGWK